MKQKMRGWRIFISAVVITASVAVPTQAQTGKPQVKKQATKKKTATPIQAAASDVYSSDITMVKVEGGSFLMGGYGDYDGKPAHTIKISSFNLSKFEVTQGLWLEVMGKNPSKHTGNDNLPVENVSWTEVQYFIRRLNLKTGKHYRLPTEAEWEFAARGGNGTKGYKYSGGFDIDVLAWYKGNSGDTTHDVGQKQPNELDIYDMSGNVIEWCSDWADVDYYRDSPAENPKGPATGTLRVHRGGSYSNEAFDERTTIRSCAGPDFSSGNIGFRIAEDL